MRRPAAATTVIHARDASDRGRSSTVTEDSQLPAVRKRKAQLKHGPQRQTPTAPREAPVRMWAQEAAPVAGGNAAAWSGVGGFLQSETFSPYDPAIVLLGISQKEMKTYVRANPAQGWLFTAASFIVAPTRGDRDVLQCVSGSMTCRTSGRRNLTQR